MNLVCCLWLDPKLHKVDFFFFSSIIRSFCQDEKFLKMTSEAVTEKPDFWWRRATCLSSFWKRILGLKIDYTFLFTLKFLFKKLFSL